MILEIPTINGSVEHRVHTVKDFPYNELLTLPTVRNRRNQNFYNVSASFDIETTTILPDNDNEPPFAFMYHWQFCIDKKVVFGRTWEEFTYFTYQLRKFMRLSENNILVVFVHNLAFEFQFMHDFITIDSLFAKDRRKPVKLLSDGIEYRCSYFLSNMSLRKFCENSKLCTHYKLDGENFDYTKIRTSRTQLTDEEKAYCFNDVYGLCECIDTLLEHDSIATLPLTNTGFVRRDCRLAMRENKGNWYNFTRTQLDKMQYLLCKKAFRGGNTHANRYYANTILKNVHSYDLQSSYPAWINLDYYPIGKFTEVKLNTSEKFYEYIDKYCVVMEIEMFDIELKEDIAIPYLDIAHCEKYRGIINDNGRVLKADYVKISITEIDFKIIKKQYNYDCFSVNYAMYSRKGKLPIELRKKMLEYYDGKTELKGIDGKEYEYMKSKNKLNSFFGMMVTAIDNDEILFSKDNNEWEIVSGNLDEQLEKFYSNRNSFLSYQWGIYVTAHARNHLQEMLDIVGMDVIYTDTDSIKFIDEKHIAEFEEMNEKLIAKCLNNDLRAYSEKDNKKYYLGIWDYEGKYERFKTLGAKKYCTVKKKKYRKRNGVNSVQINVKPNKKFIKECSKKLFKLETTVSGMSKKLGAKAVGSIENFEIGKTYHNIGRTVSYYNDENIHTITINGEEIVTASNIGIVETTYTLGVTNEYWEIIENVKEDLKREKNIRNYDFLEKSIDY